MNTNFSPFEKHETSENLNISTDLTRNTQNQVLSEFINSTTILSENSINLLFFNFLKSELFQIFSIRTFYNPTKYFPKIYEAYKKKNIQFLIQQSLFYLSSSFLYFCAPFWFFFFLSKLLFSLQVWKLSFWKIHFFISNFQNSKKKQIQFLEIDYIIGSVPFIIGFLQFLFTKYHNQSFFYFFEKNLPGISLPVENLQWETFQYIQSKKLTNIKNQNIIEKIDLSNDSLFITLNQFWNSSQKKTYIGSFQEKNFEKVVSLKSNYYELSSQILPEFEILNKKNKIFILPNILKKVNFLQDYVRIYYLNLDELPSKLDSINIFIQQSSSETFQRKNIFDFLKSFALKTNTMKLSSKKNIKVLIPISFEKSKNLSFSNFIKKNKLKVLKTEIIKSEEKNIVEFQKNVFYPHREDFFTNRELLKTSLENFFYKKGLLPKLPELNKKKFSKFSIVKLFDKNSALKLENNSYSRKNRLADFQEKNIEDVFLEEMLALIDQFLVPLDQNFFRARLNSGYRYPDTRKKQLENHLIRSFSNQFFSNFNFQKNSLIFLKTEVPDTFVSNFHFDKNNIQKFVLDKTNFLQIPFGQVSFEETLIQKTYFSGLYKNESSIYKNNLILNKFKKNSFFKKILTNLFSFHILFYDLWEPLTIKSWLVITKLSFGFFAFKLLQNIYNNYHQELSFLADVLNALGIIDEATKQELLLNDNERGFRILKKIKKKFQDIAGIESILPELGEIVWFLRNEGRLFQVGNVVPKGILFVGPPGTGKTLLVQAIAGEAQVPVLVLSGSSLHDPERPDNGAPQLKKLFQKARNLAPCIVFIDEIDTLGQKRDQVMNNPMGADEILESISDSFLLKKKNYFSELNDFLPKSKIAKNQNKIDFFNTEFESFGIQNQSNQERLALLMQFLVEMDGLQARNKILVIGATNRPDVLDSAFLRPGRFDKTFELGLPGKQKRIEILKLYSSPLGIDNIINWNYFADRTRQLSAADLAAIMNESAMRAIIQESMHNLETIEQGIDRITSYSTDKPCFANKTKQDPFFMTRLAYYQAGKTLLHSLLPEHPDMVVVHLWPRKKTTRYQSITNTLQKEISQLSSRKELENRIIGFYAGKATELLVLGQNSEVALKTKNVSNFWISDLGYEDLNFANYLVYLMIDKWYFYSKKTSLQKLIKVLENRNEEELFEFENIELFKQQTENIENPFSKLKYSDSSTLLEDYAQKRIFTPWWQSEISKELELLGRSYGRWYRLHLPNPEENEFNEEWVAADEFYHNNSCLTNLTLSQYLINWNNLYEIERDYIFHGLILNCFNKSLNFLENHRELLDYLAQYLLNHEILRQNELKNIFLRFVHIRNSNIKFEKPSKKTKQCIAYSWGKYSQRQLSRFIDFDEIN